MVFTEHGILQLSNVLKSGRAIKISFIIIDVFVKLIETFSTNTELRLEIEYVKKITNHYKNIALVYQHLDKLLDKKDNKPPRNTVRYKLPKLATKKNK